MRLKLNRQFLTFISVGQKTVTSSNKVISVIRVPNTFNSCFLKACKVPSSYYIHSSACKFSKLGGMKKFKLRLGNFVRLQHSQLQCFNLKMN